VIVATHQPVFLPWPGFFYKAARADCLVLLDDVQYPRGRSWLNRNRLKNEDGELWLTVPVWKRGRGLQVIRHVEIYDERGWRRKHLGSIQQNYARAPYFSDYFPHLDAIYAADHTLLVELNVKLIQFFLKALSIKTPLLRQSDQGITGQGTGLLVNTCTHVGADRLLTFPMVEKHIDLDALKTNGIELVRANFHPPVYPQLWGDFIYNLSILDLLLNCGPKSADIVKAQS
jgi:hypothetical protein